jgi:hypothetical protein
LTSAWARAGGSDSSCCKDSKVGMEAQIVSTELGDEPLELCNHGRIHDLGSSEKGVVIQLRSRRSQGNYTNLIEAQDFTLRLMNCSATKLEKNW